MCSCARGAVILGLLHERMSLLEITGLDKLRTTDSIKRTSNEPCLLALFETLSEIGYFELDSKNNRKIEVPFFAQHEYLSLCFMLCSEVGYTRRADGSSEIAEWSRLTHYSVRRQRCKRLLEFAAGVGSRNHGDRPGSRHHQQQLDIC